MTTTLYAAASCRFLVVTFVSETGDFETFFSNIQEVAAGRPTASYKVGVGLFQFLRPFRDDSSWSDGSCAGYQESMLQQISDTSFETARFFGVIAIVFSFIIVIWELLMIFVEFNPLQIILFCFSAAMGTLCCGMTFMVTKAALCDGIFLESQCKLDEGGLVMMAGSLLWFATLVLSAVFLRPPKNESGTRMTKAERDKIAAELEQRGSLNGKWQASDTPETRNAYSLESSVLDDDDESGRRRSRELRATLPNSRQRSIESFGRSVTSSQSTGERYARLKPRSRKQDSSGKRTIARDSIIIDDVSHPDSMEVFLSNSPGRT